MDKNKQKRLGFRRISAMIMALAMILSVVPFPAGIFSMKVNAATILHTAWTTSDGTLTDSTGTEAAEIATGGTGKVTNAAGQEMQVAGSFKKRTSNGDFQVNAGAVLKLPVVSGAKNCTVKLKAYSTVSTDSLTFSGMSNVSITTESGSGWTTYVVSGTPNADISEVTLTLLNQNYFQLIEISSSTSMATTPAAFAGDHMSAEWGCDGTIASSNSTTSIQSNTGTYTNTAGDVMYVEAPTGKFAPDTANARIQVNATTKMTLPVKGDKATVTLLIHKNNVGIDTETVLTDYLSLEGAVLLNGKCTANEVAAEDSNYRKVTITCYLAGDEGELTVTALKNTYLKGIAVSCEVLDKLAIKGSITCSTALSEGMKVTAVNKTTGVAYSSEIVNNAYSIEVTAEAEEMEYELSLSDEEYIITSGVTTHKISTASLSDVTADLSVMKLSTCILTGSISGIAADYDTSNLELVFTTDAQTEYVPEVTVDKATRTYSAKLEKGVAYTVALKGVNDYEITSASTDISYTEDSTLNITAGLKAVYPVTVMLPSIPDLTGKTVTYIYTNIEDNYHYTFSSADSIQLRNGTYTLQLGGEFLAQPYRIKTGAEVTVTDAAGTQEIRFEEITSWSFAATDDGNYYKDTVQGNTGYFNGLSIDATAGKLAPNGATPNSAQFNTGAKISIPVSGKCSISVVAYGAKYALYTIGGTAASTEDATSTYLYDSKEAGTVDIVSIGSAYIKSISVVYGEREVEYVEQTEMPKTYDYGTKDAVVVQPTGQRLAATQTGGALKTVDNGDGTYCISPTVSYYGFNETADINKITADVIINDGGSSSSNGVFFGAFNGQYIATAGIRKGTELKAILSKSETELAGAASDIAGNAEVGTVITFTAEKKDDRFVITVTPKNGETQTAEYQYTKTMLFAENGKDTAVSYGFVFSGVKATVKNMKYTAADGTVLYDQNACYYADGVAPVVESVTAKAAATRDYITVNWTASTEADGDGMYVLQVSKDNGSTWTYVDTAITDKTYRYPISEAGDYQFKVCGKLGVNGTENTYAIADEINVIAALDSPKLNIASTAEKVNLTWNAVAQANKYEVYRYSYDETAENAKLIATTTECAYEDNSVVVEMPYYYYVIAYSTDNYSNPSEAVWTVPTAGHKGEYVYEDESAGLTLTKKSYDTVFNGTITLEGVVEKASSVSLLVNGTKVDEKSVGVRGTFAFTGAAVAEGRNDVELLITDSEGNITRETFNYVYLTNYDIVVDPAYTGTDGAAVNQIPTYKTVQAAVNSVSASNTERVVIFVKEGDYEEHLTVTSPYITLIGEDSEKTRIYFDTKEWVGGDMSLRCAVNVGKTATGFSAENLTFENTYNYLGDGSLSNESCDALRNDADNTSYTNVRILGYQDTLCANGGTQYYYKCYIAGNVDYIYGNEPRAFFNDCKLVFRYSANKNSGYVCAPRASADAAYGLTFYQCQVLAEEGCSGSKYYLARPWGADAYITWIDCYMGKSIQANVQNPYTDMSGNLASEARFFEYGSFGPGYAINVNRRQISKTMADKMISADYLTWNPYAAVTTIGTTYVGTIVTDSQDKFVEKEYESDSYSGEEGDDTGLGKYNQEGYAQTGKVTGGGLLKETSDNYYTAATAEEFLKAIQSVKQSGMASVIELTADIGLGDKEVANFADYSQFITAHKNVPLTHPELLVSGVSMLKLEGMSNLTIYSKNGSKITHTCVDIVGSTNIIIRNIQFDEIWEWDENTEGGYDRNDWDYVTIEKGSSSIWIDHCTFYKAYDGVIDIKTPTNKSNVTISWCEFLPASEGSVFFDAMMNELKANPSKYPYYQHLLSEGMTEAQIYNYAYGQKKTHLLGQSDSDSSAANITVTLANNYYKDSMDRMPRLRFGTAHVYNCIMDAQNLRNYREDINNTVNSAMASKIVSNGASSNCRAHMLLENCYMSGIEKPLVSGNGSSTAGYINAVNTMYLLDDKETELEVIMNSSAEGEVALIQDETEFKEGLPYSDYKLYSASGLETVVQPYTGAGKLTLTTLQWEKTAYNDKDAEHTEHTWDNGVVTKEATCTEDGVKTYTCAICGVTKTEAIPATDHSYGTEWIVDKEATCTEAGSKHHECTVCGAKSDVTEIPATGHNYSTEWTVDKEATCTEAGSKSHHCTVCGAKTDITEIPMIVVDVDVVHKGEVPNIGLSESDEEILDKVLTEEDKTAAGSKEVKIVLAVKNYDNAVSEQEVKLIGQKLKENQFVGVYLDITLSKVIGGQMAPVLETKGGISITVAIPEKLINTDSAKVRNYSIVRIHDGQAEVLASEYNAQENKLTFVTDKFSVYAVVYEDTAVKNDEDQTTDDKTDDNQQTTEDDTTADSENTTENNNGIQTGDSVSVITVLVIVALLLFSGAVIAVLVFKKKKEDGMES